MRERLLSRLWDWRVKLETWSQALKRRSVRHHVRQGRDCHRGLWTARRMVATQNVGCSAPLALVNRGNNRFV